MIRVVLDTNVLVSANINDEGLEALVVSLALTGSLQPYISEPILKEYERVLYYRRLKFAPEEIKALIEKVHHASMMITPRYALREATHEPDNRFLECSEAADAEFLITGNTKHFPKKWKNTRIVSAREFFSRTHLLKVP
jgi:putative PIN family toxin of toxin-antitoxin system